MKMRRKMALLLAITLAFGNVAPAVADAAEAAGQTDAGILLQSEETEEGKPEEVEKDAGKMAETEKTEEKEASAEAAGRTDAGILLQGEETEEGKPEEEKDAGKMEETEKAGQKEAPAQKDRGVQNDEEPSEAEKEPFELKRGTVTDQGKISDKVSWELDSEGLFTVFATEDAGECEYITQIEGLTEEKRNQVKTIMYEGRDGGSFSQCYGYDGSLFPNAGTLVIGDGLFAYYDDEKLDHQDVMRENTVVKRVEMRGKKVHLSLRNYSALETLQISANIGDCRLSSCGSLQSIDTAKGVNRIDAIDCTALKTVHIGSVRAEEYAFNFEGDTALESIVVDEMLSETWDLEQRNFKNCKSLKKIEIPAKLKRISGNQYSGGKSSPFYGCDSLEQFPDFSNVEILGACAFENCTNLKKADFPNLVNQELYGVFSGCTGLEKVSMSGPNLDTISLGSANFRDCVNLKSLDIAADVTSVGSEEFKDCAALTEFPDFTCVTSIGSDAFLNCAGLEQIVVTGTVDRMRENAFKGCTNLKKVYIQQINNWSTRNGIFEDCVSLEQMVVGKMENPASLGGSTFRNCGKLTTLVLPAGIEWLNEREFEGCSSLRKLPDLSNLKGINVSYSEDRTTAVFKGCSSLEEVVFPETADIDGKKVSMFEGCTSLKKIVLPAGMTEIGSSMFKGCSRLEQIEGFEHIDTILDKAFWGCESLKELDLSNIQYPGCLPDGLERCQIPPQFKDIRNLFSNVKGLKEVTIPETVTRMEGAFQNLDRLERAVFTGTRTEIPKQTFLNCSGLREVQFPDGLTSIGESAFEACSGLEQMQIPEGVTRIETSAFRGCSGLEQIQFPESIKSITNEAFRGCQKLRDVLSPNGIPYCHSYAFAESGLENVEYSGALIETGAFSQCRNLKHFAVRRNIQYVNNQAFSGSALEEISLNGDSFFIEGGAFTEQTKTIRLFSNEKVELRLNAPASQTAVLPAVYGARAVYIGGGRIALDGESLIMDAGEVDVRFYGQNTSAYIVFDSQKGSVGQISQDGVANQLRVYIDSAISSISGKMTDCKNVIIYGTAGSAAETYANEQGYAFQETVPPGTENLEPGIVVEKQQGFDFKVVENEAVVTDYIGIPKLDSSGVLEVPERLAGFPVTAIQKNALGSLFSSTTSIKGLSLPSTLRTVEPGFAASGARNLKEISVASGNSYLCASDGVLYDKGRTKLIQVMPGVTEAAIPDTVTEIGDEAFAFSRVTNLTVPENVRSLGKKSLGGQSIQSVVLEGKLSEIPDSVFQGAESLKTVGLPNTVQKIGDGAFEGSGLEEIKIPAGVTAIGERAFYGCKSLRVLDLPRAVTTIGDLAFARSGLWVLTAGENVETIGDDILLGTSGEYYSIPGSRMAEYLKKNGQPDWELGNGTAIGDYILGIKVSADENGKFLSPDNFKSITLEFSRKVCNHGGRLRIMSLRDDRELASVQIDADEYGDDEEDVGYMLVGEKSFWGNNLEKKLPPDTEIYLELLGGVLHEDGMGMLSWTSKGVWSKKTISDCWKTRNPTDVISDRMFDYLYPFDLKRDMLRIRGDGTGGICFGMASAVAMVNQGKPQISSFDKKQMFEVEEGGVSTDLQITAKEIWQLAYLMQNNKNMAKQLKENKNKRDDLLEAVRKMLDGTGKPCVIGIQLNKEDVLGIFEKGSWHAVIPYYMDDYVSDGKGNSVDVYVYDCNNPSQCCILTFIVENGSVVRWNYQGTGAQISSADSLGIKYCEVDTDLFYSTAKGYHTFKNKNARLVYADKPAEQTLPDQDNRLLEVTTDLPYWISNPVSFSAGAMKGEISGNGAGGSLLVPVDPMSGEDVCGNSALYWLDDNTAPLEVNKLPSYMQLSLAGNASSITAGASRESNIIMQTADNREEQTNVSITPIRKGTYTLQMDFDPGQGKTDVDSLKITGETDGTVEVTEESGMVAISGGKDTDITAETDGQKTERKVKDTDQYEKVYVTWEKDEGNGTVDMVVQADKDGDGKPDITIPENGDNPDNPDNPDDPDNPDTPVDPGSTDPQNPAAGGQKVTQITLSRTSATLYPTQCLTLTAAVVPASAANHSVAFESTNPAVAEVSPAGVITARKAGSAKIKVIAKDGGRAAAFCSITVKAAKVTLNASKTPLQRKKSSTALKVLEMEKGDKVVSWSSSRPKIVSVSKNGKLKAGSKTGRAKITIQTQFGAKASCTITVQKKKVTLKSLSVTGKEQMIHKNRVTLKKGGKVTLIVTRNPITASEKIKYTSSSPKVASVTNKGVVKAKKKGKSKIKIMSSNGRKRVITVTVK